MEAKDEGLIKANKGGYLSLFCYGIIQNIWSNRNRIKRYKKGKTSNFHYLCDSFKQLDRSTKNPESLEDLDEMAFQHEDSYFDRIESDSYSGYNSELDIAEQKMLKQINDDMNSPDRDLHFRANIFYYSNYKYKNPRAFHKHTGIPYRVVRESFNIYKERLQKICLQPTS